MIELPDFEIIKALPFRVPSERKSYVVYFLIKDSELVYVGRTNNFFWRISGHQDDGKDFDDFRIMEFECKEATVFAEKFYVTTYKPKLNKQRYVKYVNEHFTLLNYSEIYNEC